MSLPRSSGNASASGRRLPWPVVAMITNRRLYAGSPEAASPDDGCVALVAAAATAARSGVDFGQIRERGLEDASLLDLAEAVRDGVSGSGARVLVNDRIDVALAARAAGVHLPGRAVSCGRVRAIAPDDFLIGRSVHTVDEAIAAAAGGGCDYLMFGSVFESQSKPRGHPVGGVDRLAEVCAAVTLPVLAVGGISVRRVAEVARAGASGVAAIGLFARGTDREMRRTVEEIRLAFGQRDPATGTSRH
jgi:thiamine-phosphate pyrophosphorylase